MTFAERFERLSPRLRQICVLLAGPMSRHEIEKHTGLTEATVNTYIKRVYMALDVTSRPQLAHEAHLLRESLAYERGLREGRAS